MVIGLDNGVTGSFAMIGGDRVIRAQKTPTYKEQDYTDKKQQVQRLKFRTMYHIIKRAKQNLGPIDMVLIEKPFVNPRMWKSSVSAVRCLEATLCVFEALGVTSERIRYCSSRLWQKAYLDPDLKGQTELKADSFRRGLKDFPECKDVILTHGDADGIYIALYAWEKM